MNHDFIKNPKSFGTHDGIFHADEVTACALLLKFDLINERKIIRTRDMAILEKCEFICDVGGTYDPSKKLFDHHQVEYQGQMSSAGMVWLYLKEQGFVSENIYDYLNQALILGVDAHDNGKDPQIPGVTTYSHIIANFVPIPHDSPEEIKNKAFFEALNFARGHIDRLWNRYHYIQSCRQIVSEAMKKYQDCLIFEKPIPWLELFFEMDGINHPARFVIMPAGKHWKLRGIPPSYESRMQVRHPLPQEWAGHLEDDLKKISKISGAIFCHKGRFISVWETKDDAIKAYEYTINKEML